MTVSSATLVFHDNLSMISPLNSPILIVDDSPTNAAALLMMLEQSGFEVVVASSGESALDLVAEISPSLILLDVMLPKMDGFELCRHLKATTTTQEIPIIFMTSLSRTEDKVKGLSLGAVDYITKPLQKEEIIARVNVHLNLRNLNKQLAEKTSELTVALHQLQQSQLHLVQSEKNSALGELVAGVAHEINNPVGCINANAIYASTYFREFIAHLQLYQQKASYEQIASHAEKIDLDFLIDDLPSVLNSLHESATRIKDISESLRIFSRRDTDKKIDFDLHQGIESTLLILKHRLKCDSRKSDIEVIKKYANIPYLRCFPGALNQVFMNLLANAIDSLRDYAEHFSGSHTPKIQIQTELNHHNQAVISIQDNGIGIPENIQQKIFKYAFTTKPVGKGTGLGLAIAWQIIVEKHGGCLEVDSQFGQGAKFTIKLPL
jgi:signal transduction histidine kinase